jgi:hypothetical protein
MQRARGLFFAYLIVFAVAVPPQGIAQTTLSGAGWGARIMLEPVIMAHGGFTNLCNERAARLAGWGVDQIEKLKLDGTQRTLLSDLRAAAIKAADLEAGICPRAIPRNSAERLGFTTRRMAMLSERVALISASFDRFYSSLTDEQRAQLDNGPKRWRLRQ